MAAMEEKVTPENNLPDDTVIRRIQKLFEVAKSHRANTDKRYEQEAALAMQKVQALLAAYNLELAVALDKRVEGGVQSAAIEEKRERNTFNNRSAQFQWQRDLWKAIAESNFCFHWINKLWNGTGKHGDDNYVKRHVILGKESNVIAVEMMGEYLCETIDRMFKEDYPSEKQNSRKAQSWKQGAVKRLAGRMYENIQRMKDESAKAAKAEDMALVLAAVYDREYAANYDAKYGEGAYAEKKAREAEWSREYAEREAREAEEERVRQKAWAAMLAAETDDEREKRLAKEEKERRKHREKSYRRSYSFRSSKTDDKVDWGAYSAGERAGSNISLSRQTGSASAPKQLESAD